MSEPQTPPKLFMHKPKKASHPPGGEMGEQVVRVPVVQQPAATAVPTAPLKPPFWYRYRAGVGALLLVNLGIGGYVLSRPKPVLDSQLHKGAIEPEPAKAKSAPEHVPVPVVAAAVAAPEWAPPPKVTISEEEQRQVLEWILQERRKVKTRNKAEKARIDEEKKMLKQFLRASHLPPLL
ncbi:hypothetical protein M758_UG074600 [Ceratodon purpureus]|nr:hypothetical protein M758_UG074600 [Ceratodon purpureus]